MRYVESKLEEFSREETYRIFVTESLRLSPQNQYLNVRYYDRIYHKDEKEIDGDKVALDVITRAGLRFEDD